MSDTDSSTIPTAKESNKDPFWNGHTTIAISKEVKDRLDLACPKAWSYSQMINGLLDIFEKEKKAVGKSIKSS